MRVSITQPPRSFFEKEKREKIIDPPLLYHISYFDTKKWIIEIEKNVQKFKSNEVEICNKSL